MRLSSSIMPVTDLALCMVSPMAEWRSIFKNGAWHPLWFIWKVLAFGWGGLGVVGERRIVGVTARSKSYVFRMMRAQLQILGAESASAGRALTMILMENLTTAINVIDALKREEPMSRLAAMLANLLGDLPKEESLIRASQTDLASLTNLSRATVNTALAHLESARILTRSYGSVTITNASRLLKLTGRA